MLDLTDTAPYFLNEYAMCVDDPEADPPFITNRFVAPRGRFDTWDGVIDALLIFDRSGQRLPPSHVLGIDRAPAGAPVPDESTHFIPDLGRAVRP